jgi:integrase/recombinase XerD
MTRSRVFTSWLAPYFDRFVALKRASGLLYDSAKNLLLAFDRYVHANAPETPFRRKTLIQYVTSLERLSPRGRDNAVGVVWSAVTCARRHGAPTEALPERPARSWRFWRQRQPRIVSATEIECLLAAAHRLPPEGSLRPATMATLLGLLFTTGIRIGEALALDVGDLDRRDRILTIRKGKFGKSRVLPLQQSVAEALACYVDHPLRPVCTAAADPFFVSGRRRRLADRTARSAIATVCLQAQIAHPQPRPHDFRHTFAVRRVAAWYQEGRDVNALLPALSTYLGHVSVENTRLYLTANSALLEKAAQRFAHHTSALDEVLS